MSARTRVSFAVAATALAAAAVVTAAAVLSAKEVAAPAAAAAPQPLEGKPPLSLFLGIRDDSEARQLRKASTLLEAGRTEEAARIFARYDSLEAKLGAAFAAWPASLDRIEQLGALYARSALVQLHVGLARAWAGTGGAVTAWREARDIEPDTPYAVRASDLLYRDFAPGLPVFMPSFAFRIEGKTLAAQLASLEADRTVRGRLLYGVALQRLGRPVSARRAFAEALKLDPNGIDPLVADAIGRYQKNDPTAAFSRLGPLSRRFPGSASVRFHLGLLLLWQGDVTQAKRQLGLARAADPGSRIAGEAGRFLAEVEKVGTG